MRPPTLRTFTTVLALTAPLAAQIQGPSSSRAPYIVPLAPGVQTISLLTVNDVIGTGPSAYRMERSPDGLGALGARGTSAFTLLMNHELTADAGDIHAHGQRGAFVSRWTIDRTTFAVLGGVDLVQHTHMTSGGPAFARFCSADLGHPLAFRSHKGFDAGPAVFCDGEEVGAEGRAFAHVVDGPLAGESYEIPALGNMSFENVLVRPSTGEPTVVAVTDDSSPGQVYVYAGRKRGGGSFLARAGLEGGTLYGVRVPGAPLESRTNGINGATRFQMASLGNVSTRTGAQLQSDSVAANVTQFLRPEDGAWDPLRPTDFYFATTDRFNSGSQVGRSRLWRLRFDDIDAPERGGAIAMLLDGTEGQQMLDNLTLDRRGHVILQEDPGFNAHRARIWQYTLASDQLTLLAEYDPALFTPGAPGFLTRDEESSGIIDARDVLGPGWFLLTSQVHDELTSSNDSGQLLALFNPASI